MGVLVDLFDYLSDRCYCHFLWDKPRNKVEPQEVIAHFLFKRKAFYQEGGVKWQNLQPSGRTGDKSAYRIDGLDDADVKNLGRTKVLPLRKDVKELFGEVRWEASKIIGMGLTLNPDNKPWCRHTNIAGWPDSREERKSYAQLLAAKAACTVPYDPSVKKTV